MSDRPDRDRPLERLLETLEAPAPGERFGERLWERIEAAEPEPLQRRSLHPRVRRPRLAAAVLVVLAAAAVWAAVWLGGWPAGRDEGLVGPPPAVARVIRNVTARLDSSRSLSAVFTYRRAGSAPFRARVLLTSDGRVRTMAVAAPDGSWRLPPANATLADTPGLHIEVASLPDGTRTEAWSSEGGPTVARSVNLAPGPPDAKGSGLFPMDHGGQVSALAISGSRVGAATYQGRPALVVSAPAGASPSGAAGSATPRFDRVSMTVDRETWLPVRVVRTYRGRVVESWALSDVQLDVPLHASDFSVQLPSSADLVDGRDGGFRRLTLEEAAEAVDGDLFVPAKTPDGFTLSLSAARVPEPTLRRPWLSPESSVASLVYRKGFRSVVVTTRAFAGDPPDAASDPFTRSSSRRGAEADRVVLKEGGLAGATARLSTRPLELPRLWVLEDGLLVTVAGDVSRRDLIAVAESLQAYGVGRTRAVFSAYADATRSYDLGTLSELYSRGVRIDGSVYSAQDVEDALVRNGEMTDYFVSGDTVSTFVGEGAALWEAWPGGYVAVGGWYTSDAVAEVVTVRGGRVVREEFFWVVGPNRRAGEPSAHPARLRAPPGPGDTSAAARRVALAYAAGLRAKDAARLARLSSRDVDFLDVGFGDHGRRPALRARYARMFRFPDDLTFGRARAFWGPGWAVVRWTAASESLGYDPVAGLTVLEIRGGKVARQTLYCARDRMPFR